jgi:hypothetical protein
MRALLGANLLVAAIVVAPDIAAADDKACPMDRVVAVVRSVDGDPTQVTITRAAADGQVASTTPITPAPPATPAPPVTPGMCILNGDRLEAGPQAVVTLETGSDFRHVGGQYDPVFEAPPANETVSPGVVAYINSYFHRLFNKNVQTVYATGRALAATDEAPDKCVPTQETAPPLAPLDRLRDTRQRIGADLHEIVAAWKPAEPMRSVQATLRGKEGNAIAQAETCGSGHLALPLPAGVTHPNDVLTLEITDGSPGKLTYELVVVEPKDLPLPPAATQSQWLIAAWRLAAGPPDTRLDSIARLLQTAPPDILAAQAISEAVFSDAKF